MAVKISPETRRLVQEHVIELSRENAVLRIRLREALAHVERLKKRVAELEQEPAQCA